MSSVSSKEKLTARASSKPAQFLSSSGRVGCGAGPGVPPRAKRRRFRGRGILQGVSAPGPPCGGSLALWQGVRCVR